MIKGPPMPSPKNSKPASKKSKKAEPAGPVQLPYKPPLRLQYLIPGGYGCDVSAGTVEEVRELLNLGAAKFGSAAAPAVEGFEAEKKLEDEPYDPR